MVGLSDPVGRASAVAVVIVAMVVAGCGGGGVTASSTSPAGGVPASSPPAGGAGSAPAPAGSGSASSGAPEPTAVGSAAAGGGGVALALFDLQVDGTIGGQTITGKVVNGHYTVPCQGAGADQILAVHWTGDVGTTPFQGEIDFKPGTWSLGSSSAQGTATIGLVGGKAADSLVATAGTVTTDPSGGTIDGTFTGGADSLHLAGTWTCPA